MKLCSAPLPLLLLLFFLYYHCPAGFSTVNKNPEDAQRIKQLVMEAIEYNGWVNEPDYENKLSRLYNDPLLKDLLNSVDRFRSVSTDWHSLTFTQKCHIVYNDGNNALVLAFFMDTNPEGSVTSQDCAVFKLLNTPGGWRINQMEIIWSMS